MLAMRTPSASHALTTLVFSLAAVALAPACSSGDTGDDDGNAGAGGNAGSAAPSAGKAGNAAGASGGSSGSGTMTGGTGGSTSGAGNGGSSGSGGAGAAAGVGGATGGAGSGTGGGAGAGGSSAAAGSGADAGSGGSGTSGSAGMPSAGAGGVAGSAGTGGSAGGNSAGTGGISTSGNNCPESALFCADFETPGIPAGASFRPAYQETMWQDFVAIDSSVTYDGSSGALMIKPTGMSGYSYRALSVPAPASYWVRLFVRSDVDLGQSDHNAFFGASTGNGDQNQGDLMEVAEQYCQVVMNLHDDVVLSIGGTTNCSGGGIKLPKDTWHCMEAFFDGPSGRVQVFANEMPVIDKSNWTALTYQSFVFGFISFHGPSRTMWYDDVAVAAERIGCP